MAFDLNVLGHAPREPKRLRLLRCRRAYGYHLEFGRDDILVILILQQQPSGNLLDHLAPELPVLTTSSRRFLLALSFAFAASWKDGAAIASTNTWPSPLPMPRPPPD